jgi:hypothetical protein
MPNAQADFAACLALRDARAAENKAARDRAKANPDLCAYLQAEASRRGQSGIDWPEYFRNADINYP